MAAHTNKKIMINLYSGTPGGKTYHAAAYIIEQLEKNKPVISNFNMDFKEFKKLKTTKKFHYIDNSEMTPDMFKEYAITHFRSGREDQGTIVIDEAAIILNCREYGKSDRKQWVEFFPAA